MRCAQKTIIIFSVRDVSLKPNTHSWISIRSGPCTCKYTYGTHTYASARVAVHNIERSARGKEKKKGEETIRDTEKNALHTHRIAKMYTPYHMVSTYYYNTVISTRAHMQTNITPFTPSEIRCFGVLLLCDRWCCVVVYITKLRLQTCRRARIAGISGAFVHFGIVIARNFARTCALVRLCTILKCCHSNWFFKFLTRDQ